MYKLKLFQRCPWCVLPNCHQDAWDFLLSMTVQYCLRLKVRLKHIHTICWIKFYLCRSTSLSHLKLPFASVTVLILLPLVSSYFILSHHLVMSTSQLDRFWLKDPTPSERAGWGSQRPTIPRNEYMQGCTTHQQSAQGLSWFITIFSRGSILIFTFHGDTYQNML